MSAQTNIAPRGPRLWVRILLAVSLGFNLLIIGAIAGIAIKGGPFVKGGPAAQMAMSDVGPLTRALTLKDRRAIGRKVRQATQEGGWNRELHRQSLQRMVGLLEATPFDPDAFAQELQVTVNGLESKLSVATQSLVIHLDEMSDDARLAYAERVKSAMARKNQ